MISYLKSSLVLRSIVLISLVVNGQLGYVFFKAFTVLVSACEIGQLFLSFWDSRLLVKR